MNKKQLMHELENQNTNYESKIIFWHDSEITTCILSNLEIFEKFVKITISNENQVVSKMIEISSIEEIKVEN